MGKERSTDIVWRFIQDYLGEGGSFLGIKYQTRKALLGFSYEIGEYVPLRDRPRAAKELFDLISKQKKGEK